MNRSALCMSERGSIAVCVAFNLTLLLLMVMLLNKMTVCVIAYVSIEKKFFDANYINVI